VEIPAQIEKVLFYPLLSLSGTKLTLASIGLGIFIFLAARVIGRLVGRAIREGLQRRGQPEGVAAAVSQITQYVLVFVGFAVAINTVGVDITALLAGSAVLLVGVGLGLQNITSNFVSGIIVLLERPVKTGDMVQLDDVYGTVTEIGLRSTRVVTREEVTLIIPNNEIISAKVTNLSVPTTKLRLRVSVGVAYESDMQAVRQALLEVAAAEPEVLKEPAPEVRLDGFGDSSIDCSLLCWIENPLADDEVGSNLRFAIVEAFRAHGVTIPFPQRDLHIIPQPTAKVAELEERRAGVLPSSFA